MDRTDIILEAWSKSDQNGVLRSFVAVVNPWLDCGRSESVTRRTTGNGRNSYIGDMPLYRFAGTFLTGTFFAGTFFNGIFFTGRVLAGKLSESSLARTEAR
jgi:hypothetical protein